MQFHNNKSVNLFASILIVLGFLFLFSLLIVAVPASANPSQYDLSLIPTNPPLSGQPGNPQYVDESISPLITGSIVLTDTATPTPTFEITPTSSRTPTSTSSPTLAPSATPTPLPTQLAYLPNLFHDFFNPTYTPTPSPVPILYCDHLGSPISIPDNNSAGINDDISISDPRLLVNVRLYLDISHTYVGDLKVTLTNLTTAQKITVIDRPGSPPYGCGNSDIVTILDDSAIQPADEQCASAPHAISGIYLPTQILGTFSGNSVQGTWRLNVSDQYINDTGYLNHWCLETKLADRMPPPTPAPTPVSLPSNAFISGMSGQDQFYKLDCESRSAVDWALHFGKNINELDFLENLPSSDDPETGFVGNPNGTWGNIPPNDYGVHAPPVAKVLNEYGLNASPFKSLTWDDLRAEIAAGNPAIVWIIGDNTRDIVNGTPHFYTSISTGTTTVVAPYEHTVVLVGYSPSNVTVLNGYRFFDIPLDQFLDSWSALDFIAILAR
jgi:subtilisin-like proprotein convertase family protein/uncharacterized protein YvpB